MGTLKAKLIVLCSIVFAMGIMAAGASARLEGRWALQAGDVITGEDISVQHPVSTLFHQQAYSASDAEDYGLSFPVAAGTLPFGPVNLAFPDIHEDSTQAVSTSSTGFFTANWAYIADTVAGNAGSEPLGTYLASGHPLKSPRMMGSEFLWPLMVTLPAASASTGSLTFEDAVGMPMAIGSILDHAPVYHTPKIAFDTRVNNSTAANSTIGVNNTTVMNQTSQDGNSSQPQARTPTRKPRIDPRATKEQIKNMTTMQRVYRNAFIGSTMHKAYEGPTQYPVWIDPYDNGQGVFNQIDMQKILKLALNKTQPGARIAPVFWDL